MIEKIIEEDDMKVVKVGTKKRKIFISDNGKEYDAKEDALNADEKYKLNIEIQKMIKTLESTLKKTVIDGNNTLETYTLYYLSSKELLIKYLKLLHGEYVDITINAEECEWIYENCYSGGDYQDEYLYLPFKPEVDRLNEIWNKLKYL